MDEPVDLAKLRRRWKASPDLEEAALNYLRRAVVEGTPKFILPDAVTIREAFPNNLEAQWLYGMSAYRSLRFQEAESVFQRKEFTWQSIAQARLGDCYAAQGRKIEAADCYERALLADPKNVDARAQLLLLIGNKDRPAAERLVEEANHLGISPRGILAIKRAFAESRGILTTRLRWQGSWLMTQRATSATGIRTRACWPRRGARLSSSNR